MSQHETAMREAFDSVDQRMKNAEPYREVWCNEFKVIERLIAICMRVHTCLHNIKAEGFLEHAHEQIHEAIGAMPMQAALATLPTMTEKEIKRLVWDEIVKPTIVIRCCNGERTPFGTIQDCEADAGKIGEVVARALIARFPHIEKKEGA